MEKIIVNPQQVRALGDIVSPKSVADFEKYCCTLEKSTDASFGDLYTSEFLPGARLVIDYPGSVSVDDDDFTVDVLLKDDSGAVISGASVYCNVNGDLSSETTDSNGEASFTLSCDGESTEYRFRIWYAGTDSLAGAICRGVVTVVDYESVDFSLMVDNPVLCGGEFAEFVAKVDELNGSGRVPVSGAVVEFYMDVGEVEPASISLVSSKDKLSYADGGDSCTLTATVLGSDSNPYEGATVVFKAYKNGTLVETIGSDTTDSSGVASVSYSSKGAGDLSIRAECMNLQETYAICDALIYRPNPTACTSCNIDLPSSGSISYKMSKPRIEGSSGGISMQLIDSSHTYFVGNWASDGTNGLLIRNTGSTSNLVSQTCSNITANTEYTLGVTYDNGDWTCFKDNEVKSFSANYTPTKLNIIQIQQGTIKDLIIKPL